MFDGDGDPNVKAVVLFRLGGKTNWSLPIAVHPVHVASVEAYLRNGKPPTVPRCTVTMYSGKEYRVVGDRDHVLRWLGWKADCGIDAYKKFVAMVPDSPQVAAPSSDAPADAAGGGKEAAAGSSGGSPTMSVVGDDVPTTGEPAVVAVPGVIPVSRFAGDNALSAVGTPSVAGSGLDSL